MLFKQQPEARTAILTDAVRDAEGRIRSGAHQWGPKLIQEIVQKWEGLADSLGVTKEKPAPRPSPILGGVGMAPGATGTPGLQPDDTPTMDPRDLVKKGGVAKFADRMLANVNFAEDESGII